MGSKNRSAARFRICSGHRSDSRSGGSGGWKAAGTNEERKRRAGVHFPGRHLLLTSCRSGTRFSGGRGALPRLLSPASRRVDSRSGGDGGAGSGRDGGSARCEKAGAARGAKKGTGGAGSPFPRWVASLPHIARIPGPARNGGARRPYPVPMSFCPPPHVARIPGPARNGGARRPYLASIRFSVQRGWWGAASLPHVDQVPGSAGMVGRERDAKRHGHRAWAAVCAGERTGRRGGHPPPTSIGLPVQRGEAGRGKGEVRADPAECNSPRTVRAGRFALDPGGYLSSRAVSSQVLSAYEGLTAVFGMGTGSLYNRCRLFYYDFIALSRKF